MAANWRRDAPVTMEPMRRALAMVLLTLFSLPLIAPAFALAPDESQLPACCRRGGKHQCASSSYVVSEKCPHCPFTHPLLMPPHPLASIVRPVALGPVQGPASIVYAAEAGYRVSVDRTRHKRGPPENLSL
jgi:hypothetical protein